MYSDTLTREDVHRAFLDALLIDGQDIHIDSMREFRAQGVTTRNYGTGRMISVKHYRKHGVEFFAKSTDGKRASGHHEIASGPADHYPRAASWDAYGYVIARLFAKDPDAIIGNYAGVVDFIEQVEAANRKEPKDFLKLVRLDRVRPVRTLGPDAAPHCRHHLQFRSDCAACVSERESRS